MKVKFRFVKDGETLYLMGMAFVYGKHRMTGLPFPEGADIERAKKIIRKAFAKFQAQ